MSKGVCLGRRLSVHKSSYGQAYSEADTDNRLYGGRIEIVPHVDLSPIAAAGFDTDLGMSGRGLASME